MNRAPRAGCPRLTLVTDLSRSRWPLVELVARCVAGGVDSVQVRVPQSSAGVQRDLVESLLPLCGDQALIVVNNDAALAMEQDTGLHLPERAPQPDTEGFRFVSRAVHTPVAAARVVGCDAIIAGHVFASASKPGGVPLGTDGLHAIVEAAHAPVIAIGGIDSDNAAACVRAGAVGVAVVGSLSESEDPTRDAEKLQRAIDTALDAFGSTRSEDVRLGTRGAANMIEVVLNGKSERVGPHTTVSDLLARKRLRAAMVAVEHNREILQRDHFDTTVLQEGDHLEIVHFVGGG